MRLTAALIVTLVGAAPRAASDAHGAPLSRADELSSPRVVVELLEPAPRTAGYELAGGLAALSRDAAEVETESGVARVPLQRVVSIRRPESGEPLGVRRPLGEAWLADGTRFPIDSWTAEGEAFRFSLDSATLVVDRSRLAALRPRPLGGASAGEEIESQWRAARRAAGSSDVLVVRRTGKGAIDYVEGVVEQIGAEGVRFVLDGEAVDVPWERVFGVVLLQPAAPEPDAAPIRVTTTAGAALVARDIELRQHRLVATGDGWSAELDWAPGVEVDVSAGKVFMASGLRVVSTAYTPRTQPLGPVSAELLERIGRGGSPVADRSLDGSELTLRFSDPRAPGVGVVRRFESGWAMRSGAELVLELPPGANRLRGWVGIDPATADAGDASVAVLADDRALLRFAARGADEPTEIDLSLRASDGDDPPRSLTLRVDYGDNLDTGDRVHFADLRVTR